MQFLAIEGNIGAGKTTLAKLIGNRLDARVILEQFSDNPFLPGFYKDPARYAFPLELSFLAARYNQLRSELIEPDMFRSLIVTDYYFAKSLIFSGVTLTGHEYRLYRELYQIMSVPIPRPDIYVYLHTGTEKLLSNIKKRERPYEQGITAEYLDSLQRSYHDFMKQQEGFTFLVLETGSSDFVANEADLDLIIETIFAGNYQTGINRIVL